MGGGWTHAAFGFSWVCSWSMETTTSDGAGACWVPEAGGGSWAWIKLHPSSAIKRPAAPSMRWIARAISFVYVAVLPRSRPHGRPRVSALRTTYPTDGSLNLYSFSYARKYCQYRELPCFRAILP